MNARGREKRAQRRLRIHASAFLLVLGVIVLIAMVRLWQPVSRARQQREEIARLRAVKAALQNENKQLKTEKHHLASDEGQEATARQAGYLKPGERRVYFVQEKPKEKKATTPAPPVEQAH